MYLELAKSIATKAHEGQTRWDKFTPYITHPEAVANLVEQEKEKVVAWLHDVVEDTPITLSDLMDSFPTDIVSAVDAITKRGNEDYDKYIRRVGNNPLSRVVKIADITHNLSDLKKGSMRDKYMVARMYLREMRFKHLSTKED